LAHDEKSNSDNFPPKDCVVYWRLGGQTTSQYWPIVCFFERQDGTEVLGRESEGRNRIRANWIRERH
jgi:hypothetical protein